MTPTAIVEGLNVVEDGGTERCSGRPALAIQELGLEGGPEALGSRIVIDISHAAHGAKDPSLVEPLAEGNRGVLCAVIGVVNETGTRLAVEDGHVHGHAFTPTPSRRQAGKWFGARGLAPSTCQLASWVFAAPGQSSKPPCVSTRVAIIGQERCG